MKPKTLSERAAVIKGAKRLAWRSLNGALDCLSEAMEHLGAIEPGGRSEDIVRREAVVRVALRMLEIEIENGE